MIKTIVALLVLITLAPHAVHCQGGFRISTYGVHKPNEHLPSHRVMEGNGGNRPWTGGTKAKVYYKGLKPNPGIGISVIQHTKKNSGTLPHWSTYILYINGETECSNDGRPVDEVTDNYNRKFMEKEELPW